MKGVITFHSPRGGTGKSTISSSFATKLALMGNRVLIVDTDIKSPGIHALFGLNENNLDITLNDYLDGLCDIEDCIYDISEMANLSDHNLFITPASIKKESISKTLKEKDNSRKLQLAFRELFEKFELDFIVVDTHPGMNENVLVAGELSDHFFMILRPDNQDYQSINVSKEIYHKLDFNTSLIVNQIVPSINTLQLNKQLKNKFKIDDIFFFKFDINILSNQSKKIFILKSPYSDFSKQIKKLCDFVLNNT